MNGEQTEGVRSHIANSIQVLSIAPHITKEMQRTLRRLRLALVNLDVAIDVVRQMREKYEDPEYIQLMELLS